MPHSTQPDRSESRTHALAFGGELPSSPPVALVGLVADRCRSGVTVVDLPCCADMVITDTDTGELMQRACYHAGTTSFPQSSTVQCSVVGGGNARGETSEVTLARVDLAYRSRDAARKAGPNICNVDLFPLTENSRVAKALMNAGRPLQCKVRRHQRLSDDVIDVRQGSSVCRERLPCKRGV